MTAAKGDTARDRTKCGGLKKNGGLCGRPAGWGTPHPGVGRCKLHLGCTASHVHAAQRELAERELAELRSLGHPVPADQVDPGAALLAMVGEAIGNVDELRQMVRALPSPVEESPLAGSREHALAELYRTWCDRQADYATRALRAGVQERRMQMDEFLAAILGQFVRDLLVSPVLGLDFEHQMAGLEEAGRLMRALPAA